MLSSSFSILSQKLISCDAVPDETSRESLVTVWISLIHELTSAWSLLRKVGSERRDWGSIASTEILCPFAAHWGVSFIRTLTTHSGNSLADRWVDGQVNLWDLDVLLEVEEGELELGKLLLGHGDTHLRLSTLLASRGAIVDGSLGRDVRVKPWRHAPVDERVEAVVWGRLGRGRRDNRPWGGGAAAPSKMGKCACGKLDKMELRAEGHERIEYR